MNRSFVPNQIFIGCPWYRVRTKYEQIIEEFKKKYPLSFVIVGRGDDQKAEDLLDIIKERLQSSSNAIFDASQDNPNVSLEYGLAEAWEMPRVIYISRHRRARNSGSDSAIISDLAGKKRNEYKQKGSLAKLLAQFAQGHAYTKRYETFFRQTFRRSAKGTKKRMRALSLKIIHFLDGKVSVRRSDIVQDLTALNYKEDEVNDCLRKLHNGNLIVCSEGRYSSVSMQWKK